MNFRISLATSLLAMLIGVLHSQQALSQLTSTQDPQAPSRTKVVNTGHNVTQTAYLFPKGRCTVGTLLVGCGVSNHMTLATSPWLLDYYNMANLSARFGVEKTEHRETAIQVGYFKTFKTGKSLPEQSDPNSPSYDPTYCVSYSCNVGYEMEAAWLYWLRSHHLTKDYTFHWNFDVAYYWNDKKPFSIRRPQAWKTPWQLNLTSLHEVHLIKNFYMEGEIGILGLTEKFQSFHSGATLSYRARTWGFKFGMSATGTLAGWLATNRYDVHSQTRWTRQGLSRNFSDSELQQDFAIHPELSAQWYFDI